MELQPETVRINDVLGRGPVVFGETNSSRKQIMTTVKLSNLHFMVNEKVPLGMITPF